MPTAARHPTATAATNPNIVAPTVRSAWSKNHSGALMISWKMALGAGSRYSGGVASMTASCHVTKNPTTTRPTCRVRQAAED